MTVDEALKLIEGISKYSHSLLVSEIMGRLADRLGEDREKWKLVGLLHDYDYDSVRDDMSQHGVVSSEKFAWKLSEDALYAIKCHDHRTEFKAESTLDKGLIIADSIVNIIERVEIHTHQLNDVEVEIDRISVKEPWLKANIMKCDEIGISYSDLLRLIIKIRNSFP
jgi:putative nucleotidyltransferase with HDIG domain